MIVDLVVVCFHVLWSAFCGGEKEREMLNGEKKCEVKS